MAHSYKHDLSDQLAAEGNGPATVPKEGASGNQNVTGNLVVAGTITSSTITIAGGAGLDTTGPLTGSSLTLTQGLVFPTADPHVSGMWWDSAGTLTKSSG